MSEWISIDDRLPPPCRDCVVIVMEGQSRRCLSIARHTDHGWRYYDDGEPLNFGEIVTHWMSDVIPSTVFMPVCPVCGYTHDWVHKATKVH